MVAGFELCRLAENGDRAEVVVCGNMSALVSLVRARGLIAQSDPHHPLGVFYRDSQQNIYTVDFICPRAS